MHYTPDLLDCQTPATFWISWADGYVEVGRGYEVGSGR